MPAVSSACGSDASSGLALFTHPLLTVHCALHRRTCYKPPTLLPNACTPVRALCSAALVRGRRETDTPLCVDCFACLERVLNEDEEDSETGRCPVCQRSLGRKPYESGELRFDRALTALCMQIFPRPGDDERMRAAIAREEELRAEVRRQQAAAEARSRRETYHRKAVHALAGAPRPEVEAEQSAILPSVDSVTVLFELRQLMVPNSIAVPVTMDRPFLRTPPSLTAHALALYIACQLPPGSGHVFVCNRHGQPFAQTALVTSFLHTDDAQHPSSGAVPVVYFFCGALPSHGGLLGDGYM